MEQIIKHYGPAILVASVLLMLGIILGIALQPDGYIAEAFKEAFQKLFDMMFDLVPANSP